MQLVCRHHPCEFFVVELSVAVRVRLPHEGVDLLVGQPLPQGGRDPAELLHLDVTVFVLVEHPEGQTESLQGKRQKSKINKQIQKINHTTY